MFQVVYSICQDVLLPSWLCCDYKKNSADCSDGEYSDSELDDPFINAAEEVELDSSGEESDIDSASEDDDSDSQNQCSELGLHQKRWNSLSSFGNFSCETTSLATAKYTELQVWPNCICNERNH
ncbi:unnamed protein product [Clavelina lepadiformis]|uniref:Uncharacterized protein n=1 Tax=Clavelina lepadiformis TaxID=159417 RepID=A0ABP0H0T9_CLALP